MTCSRLVPLVMPPVPRRSPCSWKSLVSNCANDGKTRVRTKISSRIDGPQFGQGDMTYDCQLHVQSAI